MEHLSARFFLLIYFNPELIPTSSHSWFLTCYWLCNHHHHPSLELFSSCRTEILYPLNNNSSFSIFHAPWKGTILLSVSMNLTTLGTSYKWIHTVYMFFCVWLISLSIMYIVGVPPCCSLCQNCFPFLRLNNILLHVYTTFFTYPFIHLWTLRLLPQFSCYD